MQSAEVLHFAGATPERPPTLPGLLATIGHLSVIVIGKLLRSWNSHALDCLDIFRRENHRFENNVGENSRGISVVVPQTSEVLGLLVCDNGAAN